MPEVLAGPASRPTVLRVLGLTRPAPCPSPGERPEVLYVKFTRKEQALRFAWLLKGRPEFLGFQHDLIRLVLGKYDFLGRPRTS